MNPVALSSQSSQKRYNFGPFSLDERRLVLLLRREPLQLGPKVVRTLLTFIESNGEVLSKNELLERVWGDADVGEGSLTQNVYVLRNLFEEHYPEAKIQTIPRRGYRFCADVRASEPETHEAPKAGARARNPLARYAFGLAVMAVLVMTIGSSLVAGLGRHRPVLSPAGAQLYAVGMYYWRQRSQPAIAKSIAYFTAVTQSDPNDSRGYAGLSEAYIIEGSYHYGPRSPKTLYSIGRRYALRALALNPNSAEAHAALGQAEDVPATRAAAAREYRKAIELDPGYAPARQWYGQSLMQRGQYAAAYEQLKRASQLDPTAVSTLNALASAAYVSRNFSEALTYAKRTIDLSPKRADAQAVLGLASEARGDIAQAIASYQQYETLCGRECRGDAAALLAHAYATAGRLDAARQELRVALTSSYPHGDERMPPNLVAALLALGQRSQALAAVQMAKLHGGLYTSDPRLDAVRSDPSFKRYLN